MNSVRKRIEDTVLEANSHPQVHFPKIFFSELVLFYSPSTFVYIT